MADSDSRPFLELQNVSYRYADGTLALDSLCLEVRPGERLAVLGSNGCGKSTLLKLLDGLIFPTSGVFRAFGVEMSEAALQDDQFSQAFRQKIGFIFQRSDVQLFSPTVWDEIAFGPLQLGLDAASVRVRVADVVAMLDLGRICDRAPYQLSGGEQKKVAIAATLAVNPQALLMDEPTAALDPRSQRWLLDLLQTLSRSGKTLIVTTHDLDLAPVLCDRAVVLGPDHRVERDGAIGAILADHDLLHRANLAHHHPITGQVYGAHVHPDSN
ncbi:MAG TPA: ABC transporter ATP-binding protein [Armatimonadota bacterium]|nr:ABC transporter ATP-binding protein [Armatimonadota bacterium]